MEIRRSVSARLVPLALPLIAIPVSAWAHGDHVHEGTSPWSMWAFSPEIVIGILLAGWIYWRGVRHDVAGHGWRIAAFFGGLFALFVALISPVEELADHIFAVHQVEHMLLRTIAPMLLFLSRPQAAMVRGLPAGVSRFFAGRGWLRAVIDGLRYPPVVTLLFLAASYFWMIPRYHDMAIENEPIHYLWHISLLVTGLLFFSVIFDRRTAPQGPGLGTRLAMFVAAALGNIALGSFLTFKNVALYHAYIELGHMWHVSMLSDEQTGGIIMWIPGTMMFAVSALIVLYRFGSEEQRVTDQRLRAGRELVVEPKRNRALAFGLGAFALMLLAVVFSLVAAIDHHPGGQRDFGMAGEIPG